MKCEMLICDEKGCALLRKSCLPFFRKVGRSAWELKGKSYWYDILFLETHTRTRTLRLGTVRERFHVSNPKSQQYSVPADMPSAGHAYKDL